ncbi:amino acid permease-associated region domain protein [Yersinia pestis]|nr:amino acid permease-associated region domain protein [Yersinia pestis]
MGTVTRYRLLRIRGGIIRYPVFSHDELRVCLLEFITSIHFSSLITIEIVAARQYALTWFSEYKKSGNRDCAGLINLMMSVSLPYNWAGSSVNCGSARRKARVFQTI